MISLRVPLARFLLTGCLMASEACLLPPDGLDPGAVPYAPTFDAIVPQEPFFELRDDCISFTLGVRGLSDPDSPLLRTRWVVNNNLENTQNLRRDRIVFGTSLQPELTERIVVDDDLAINGRLAFDTPIVSLFITDGEGWTVDEPPVPGESANLGVPLGEGSVLEVRWAFTFGRNGAGECPPQ